MFVDILVVWVVYMFMSAAFAAVMDYSEWKRKTEHEERCRAADDRNALKYWADDPHSWN